jgi:hypothetical protein
MDRFDSRVLEGLTASMGFPRVSMYLPTRRAGKEVRQNPIRLKNLLAESARKLEASGQKKADIDRVLEPARRLLDAMDFWNHQSDGLAVFLDGGTIQTFRLPVPFGELAVVTDRFHVKPLVAFVAGDRKFYVLAVSQKEFRLIRCTRYTAGTVPVEDAPGNIFEATGIDRSEKQLQFHTGPPGRGGKRSAIFHGTGAAAGNPDVKKLILKYFRQIDGGIARVLEGNNVPLVVATVDHLIPLYREANTYPHLCERGLPGNPEGVTDEDLRDAALELLEGDFRREREAAAGEYGRLGARGLASGDLDEIVVAAHHARIDTLFVPVGRNRWGRFDPESTTVEVHDSEQPGDQDLMDLAAVRSLNAGARVFAVAPDDVPGGGEVAAVFRF